jgi:predicted Co/Zn/Cd cation transporter (cation efflux family)
VDASPRAGPGRVDDRVRRERSALAGSAAAAGVVGTGAVVWGLVAGSGLILFDGVYALAGIALVAISFLASRAAGSTPSDRYPFGRHAATPLAVAMQGAALLATLVYGTADAIGTLVAGGSDGDPWSLVVYGAASAVVSGLAAVALRRRAPDSELVHAEVVSWRAGAWLSVVVALGGVVGLVLERAGRPVAAGYVDPVLLLVAVVLITPLPVRLVRDGMHELLEGAPPAPVEAEIARVVALAREEHGLPEPLVRATKLGRRLYVEVDFVVLAGAGWDVDAEDAVRHAVVDPLRALPYDVWATVELTTDPGLTL